MAGKFDVVGEFVCRAEVTSRVDVCIPGNGSTSKVAMGNWFLPTLNM